MTDPRPPAQQQEHPGRTDQMEPEPHDEMAGYEGRQLLAGRRALVTGGDSGIGRATAIAFAKEGADVAIAYLDEHDDARHTAELVEKAGARCVLLPGDLAVEEACIEAVERTVAELGGIELLVNNLAYQQPQDSLEDISTEQWDRTFRTNIYSYFWCTKRALAHMGPGSAIINTASINGLRGNKSLIDYSATKGAILAFTYSMAQALVDRQIRVNCVAPGPVWTPLNPADQDAEKIKKFGGDTLLKRPAQPEELSPAYVFLASPVCSSYITGEILPVLGGRAGG